MFRVLNTAVSALNATAKDLEVIGHNIANTSTTAFKYSEAKYGSSFYDVVSNALPTTDGSAGRLPIAVGLGTKITATVTDFSTQGGIVETGRPLDLAIDGNGFFKTRDINTGSMYATRVGELRRDTQGYLVTLDGKRIQGLSGGDFKFTVTKAGDQYIWKVDPLNVTPPATEATDILIQPNADLTVLSGKVINNTGDADALVEKSAPSLKDDIEVTNTGDILLSFNDGTSYIAGKILLMNFNDPSSLNPEGNGYFSGFDAAGSIGSFIDNDNSPGKKGLGTLKSRSLESSNVDLTAEFAKLMTRQRVYQAGARVFDMSSQLLQTTVNLGA